MSEVESLLSLCEPRMLQSTKSKGALGFNEELDECFFKIVLMNSCVLSAA